MVVDSVQGRDPSRRFYKRDECVNMRLNRSISARTRIWIGRSQLSALSAIGTLVGAFNPDRTAKMPGMVVNIVVGHLAIQLFSFRVEPEDPKINDPEPKPGKWENLLIPVWPFKRGVLTWPPRETFTNRVGPYPIALLMDRWRIGKKFLCHIRIECGAAAFPTSSLPTSARWWDGPSSSTPASSATRPKTRSLQIDCMPTCRAIKCVAGSRRTTSREAASCTSKLTRPFACLTSCC